MFVGVKTAPPSLTSPGKRSHDNVKAISVKRRIEKKIQEKYLKNRVDKIEGFYNNLQECKVVECASAEASEASSREDVLEAESALVTTRSLQHQLAANPVA